MKYFVITTQPGIYDSFLQTDLVSRGIDKKIIDINVHNLHDYAFDAHKSVDDTPSGGGPGMILRVDVMANAINSIKKQDTIFRNTEIPRQVNLPINKIQTILLTPQGKKFTQNDAKRLSKEKNLILIAGRFEGYDERIRDLMDEEISVGDYVLTSGDLPAMVLIDATSRMIPGFIEKSESIAEESFSLKSEILLEYPQYTRPESFHGKKIPEILLSGNHAEIAKWRRAQSIKRTKDRRPDIKI